MSDNRLRTSAMCRAAVWFCTVMICAAPALALPAFPGAEGFGADSTGGRGGDVYHVTSLADTNTAGTLRNAISSAPASGRTIVFDVSGTIALTSELQVNKSKITIAGQTAPGQGITLRNRQLMLTGSNVVVQHLHVRLGEAGGAVDAVGVENGSNVVVDHLSASWSGDEGLSVSDNATNVSVQNSFISEALNYDNHSFGSLIRPDINSNVTYHHNLYAHNRSRNPRPGTYNGSLLKLDFVNNIIYNWIDEVGYSGGSGEYVDMNFVGNYSIAGPTTGSKTQRLFNGGSTDTRMYRTGNKNDPNKNAALDGVVATSGTPYFVGTFTSMTTPFAYPAVTTDSPDAAYAKVMLRSGALPWARDAIDARIVEDVKNNTGTIILTESAVGGFLAIPVVTRPANWDSDNDGMPNWWEYGRGHNVAINDGSVITGSGYSNLEHYLNYITNTSNWGVDSNGNWSSDANWLGGAPTGTDAVAGFYAEARGVSSFSSSRTVTLDAARTVGMVNLDSTAAFTLGGTSTLTLDDSGGRAAVNVLRGNHTIAAPLNLADNTTFVVMNVGNSLAVTGNMTAAGKSITKAGLGTAQFENIRADSLIVNGGTVRISTKNNANDPAGTSVVNSLSITDSVLDLSNNSMVIDYAGSVGTLEDDVRVLLQAGRIVSSTAGTPAGTRLGYADDSTAGSLLIKFTYAGDANLDGQVTIADLGEMASNWQSTTAVWQQGDFNYDGQVTIADLGDLASNWQAGVGSPLGMSFNEALAAVGFGAAVPEPACVGVIGFLIAARSRRPSFKIDERNS